MKRALLLTLVVLSLCCCGAAAYVFLVSDTATESVAEAPAEASTAVPPFTVTTDNGDIQVPGPAYLDGRDQAAEPPLTMMEINIWQERGGESLSPLACDRPHAHPVRVLAAEEFDGRTWFQVDAGDGCIGWLLDSLIGPEATETIGEEIYLREQ